MPERLLLQLLRQLVQFQSSAAFGHISGLAGARHHGTGSVALQPIANQSYVGN